MHDAAGGVVLLGAEHIDVLRLQGEERYFGAGGHKAEEQENDEEDKEKDRALRVSQQEGKGKMR
ncbi:hypothetical protein GCM10023184_05260 [Flaviaesturariibacter amylovorans]|uniref:Uncharacterized protein n=1 Tax=Flaviaesturariibacter amylovorans TaxID=1084520 RepID=A0ABP8G9V8_9BACT